MVPTVMMAFELSVLSVRYKHRYPARFFTTPSIFSTPANAYQKSRCQMLTATLGIGCTLAAAVRAASCDVSKQPRPAKWRDSEASFL